MSPTTERPGSASGGPLAGRRADELRRAHAEGAMVGWDFSRLDGRLFSDDPPWDFESICADAMGRAASVLDLGTGGGERLLALLTRIDPHRPGRLSATEGWASNEPVAAANLAPSGVDVHHYDAGSGKRLPFPDASFDLVMSRHEAYDEAEVARVLRPGGLFCTQQVGGDDAAELRAWFGGDMSYPEVRLDVFGERAESAGLRVTRCGDWTGTMVFTDALALVEYLAMVPWDVPGFRVDDHLPQLLELDRAPIWVTQRRFWLRAEKAGA